jgi:hypothetical protein
MDRDDRRGILEVVNESQASKFPSSAEEGNMLANANALAPSSIIFTRINSIART